MSDEKGNFRGKLFGGFNRRDVVDYIEKLAAERNSLKTDGEDLRKKMDRLSEDARRRDEEQDAGSRQMLEAQELARSAAEAKLAAEQACAAADERTKRLEQRLAEAEEQLRSSEQRTISAGERAAAAEKRAQTAEAALARTEEKLRKAEMTVAGYEKYCAETSGKIESAAAALRQALDALAPEQAEDAAENVPEK